MKYFVLLNTMDNKPVPLVTGSDDHIMFFDSKESAMQTANTNGLGNKYGFIVYPWTDSPVELDEDEAKGDPVSFVDSLSKEEFWTVKGKIESNTASKSEITSFMNILVTIVEMVESASEDDFYGTEGWEHMIGWE